MIAPRALRPGFSRWLRLMLFTALIGSLACAGTVQGDTAFSIEALGSGAYAIKGSDMANIAALDFTVTYDPAAMTKPRVTKGAVVPADANFFTNTAMAGELRIMLVRSQEITGSGTLATISFEPVGKSAAPGILAFKSNPISVTAVPLPSQVRSGTEAAPPESADSLPGNIPAAVPPSPNPAGAAPPVPVPVPIITGTINSDARQENSPVYREIRRLTAAAPAKTAAASAMGGAVVTRGTIVVPLDEQAVLPLTAAGETSDLAAVTSPDVPEQSKAAGIGSESEQVLVQQPLKTSQVRRQRFVSVLERFSAMRGDRSAAALMALFSGGTGSVTQTPAVAISDGRTPVTVRFILENQGGDVPNFTLEKARLLECNPDQWGWVLTIIPEKGAVRARVTMSGDSALVEYPVTVAPPLDATVHGPGLDESGLAHFLAERGTAAAPTYDLNGDGVRDYIDDYIFAANVLAARRVEK